MNIMDKILIMILLFNLILGSLKDGDRPRVFLYCAILVMQNFIILSEVFK